MPRHAARRRAPPRRASGVTLAEFKQLQEITRQNAEDLKVQFLRIAQIQAELDTVKQGRKSERTGSLTGDSNGRRTDD